MNQRDLGIVWCILAWPQHAGPLILISVSVWFNRPWVVKLISRRRCAVEEQSTARVDCTRMSPYRVGGAGLRFLVVSFVQRRVPKEKPRRDCDETRAYSAALGELFRLLYKGGGAVYSLWLHRLSETFPQSHSRFTNLNKIMSFITIHPWVLFLSLIFFLLSQFHAPEIVVSQESYSHLFWPAFF